MQLPMGNFREIVKPELISSILNEIERTKFSGICQISSGPVDGTVVFKSGKCILAEFQDKTGDEAWNELIKMSNYNVCAAFLGLDDAQVKQALEFNKACHIIKAGNTIPLTAPQLQNIAAPVYATPKIPVQQPQEPEKSTQTDEPPQDSSSFEQDIDTFDTLDMDNVTDKIRNECKTIVKKLDLEHLMEQ